MIPTAKVTLLVVEVTISTRCRPRFSLAKSAEANQTSAMVQLFKLVEELTPTLQINLFPREDQWEFADLAHPRTCLSTLHRQWEEEWGIQFLSWYHLTVPHKIKALIPFILLALEDNLSEVKVSEIEDLCGLREASQTTLRIISSCNSRST